MNHTLGTASLEEGLLLLLLLLLLLIVDVVVVFESGVDSTPVTLCFFPAKLGEVTRWQM